MKPELLMPAGSFEKLKYAYSYGADAVYVGVPLFGLRARENEMTLEDLTNSIAYAREHKKQIYVTANIFARNLKLKSFRENFKKWVDLKPDAFIMSDPGLMMIAKEVDPNVNIHLSVQSNCMNWQSVKFWQQQGASRIILSRELRLEEIKEIRDRVPDIELEAFVHGSICIAYSGRCLLSHYMSYRDANQGVCDNSCRYGYNIFRADSEKDEEYRTNLLLNFLKACSDIINPPASTGIATSSIEISSTATIATSSIEISSTSTTGKKKALKSITIEDKKSLKEAVSILAKDTLTTTKLASVLYILCEGSILIGMNNTIRAKIIDKLDIYETPAAETIIALLNMYNNDIEEDSFDRVSDDFAIVKERKSLAEIIADRKASK